MEIISTVGELKDRIKSWKKEGQTIGLVPTMGFLHEGHLSLVRGARQGNDRTAVSILSIPSNSGQPKIIKYIRGTLTAMQPYWRRRVLIWFSILRLRRCILPVTGLMSKLMIWRINFAAVPVPAIFEECAPSS